MELYAGCLSLSWSNPLDSQQSEGMAQRAVLSVDINYLPHNMRPHVYPDLHLVNATFTFQGSRLTLLNSPSILSSPVLFIVCCHLTCGWDLPAAPLIVLHRWYSFRRGWKISCITLWAASFALNPVKLNNSSGFLWVALVMVIIVLYLRKHESPVNVVAIFITWMQHINVWICLYYVCPLM